MTESDVIRILHRHCTEQKLKFFAHVYRGTKGYILDGFAMSQAYRNMRTIGYEVKVSRNDFLQDKKWQNYLPVCNTFYFVSPPEVIRKDDLPAGIGLYHVVDNRLVCVKKAKRNEFDKDAVFEVLQYIVLSRGLSERMKVKSAVSHMHFAQNRANDLERRLRNTQRRCNEVENELWEIKRKVKEATNGR
ncbi:MmcB family DNA repair protein [Sporomusa sphaeroides]|uniref:Uncharacterized protein n=1 Tax=Sporomusa sphaeroides DSM 2875 TaxID=1337886 RepID=A0ABM9W005_9FIRM|nr:MmcB family DNA repair protein [Sporomusa sphaeroides]OLS56389.1 hypothetical protein SPSPH_27820 [Sporomusa sphaeroides DSM 2875]CVK18484.1 hypothetical protein SSPH_01122 [Sporomusa sphaeroides DSM 2875]